MDAPTLEMKPLREENGAIPSTDDQSSSPYPSTPKPLPPYSDMDHDLVKSERNNLSNDDNNIESDNNCERETRDKDIQAKNDRTAGALSAFYAQVVLVATAVLVFTEVLHGPIPLLFFQGYVFTYLVGGSILIFLYIYIRVRVSKCRGVTNPEGDVNNEQFSTPFMRNLLNSDVSIYFRTGAAIFGCVTLISCGMEIASIFIISSDCMDGLNSAQAILRASFSFLQLYLLFMNSRKILDALGWFRHVALMHLIATNLSIWIRLVLWETAKDWLDATHIRHNSSTIWRSSKEFSLTVHTLESDVKSSDILQHTPVHKTYFTTNCYWRPTEEVEKAEDIISLQLCLRNSTTGAIWQEALPYLYPLMIQYNLVAAVVIYMTWSNFQTPHCRLKQMTAISVRKNSLNKQEVNCAGYRTGLVLGLVILTAGITSLILFYVLYEVKHLNNFLDREITVLRCVIFAVSSFATALGTSQIRKMKPRTNRHYLLTEILQRIGVFVVYVFGICNMTAGGISITETRHLLLFLDGMLMMIQAFLQSFFIHQVTRKRVGASNVNDKPGRNVVIFLVFNNMTLWLFETFMRQNEENILQLQFFGAIAWPILWRTLMPLVIFYRFHSAVCLMEAWKKSYKIK